MCADFVYQIVWYFIIFNIVLLCCSVGFIMSIYGYFYTELLNVYIHNVATALQKKKKTDNKCSTFG